MLTPLRVLRELMKSNPTMLDDGTCPYPKQVKEFLRELMSAGQGSLGWDQLVEVPIELDDPEQLLREFEKIYSQLQAIQTTFGSLDPKDRVQWAKAAIGLLERVVTLKERTFNLKNHSTFQKTVLDVLEQVLTPDQRSAFVDKLGDYR